MIYNLFKLFLFASDDRMAKLTLDLGFQRNAQKEHKLNPISFILLYFVLSAVLGYIFMPYILQQKVINLPSFMKFDGYATIDYIQLMLLAIFIYPLFATFAVYMIARHAAKKNWYEPRIYKSYYEKTKYKEAKAPKYVTTYPQKRVYVKSHLEPTKDYFEFLEYGHNREVIDGYQAYDDNGKLYDCDSAGNPL